MSDLRGTTDTAIWIPKGSIGDYSNQKDIKFDEVIATHIENQIRKEHSIPLRTSYLVGGPYSVWSRIIDGSGNSLYFNKQGDFSRKMIVPSQRFKY